MTVYNLNNILSAIVQASATLSARKEEINRLNVFPVPDGDTGTNMSLTLESVVDNLSKLTIECSLAEASRAITNGALMGARGNSGVITSQILRGLCEGSLKVEEFNTESLDIAFARAEEVAFQAVRKPVEGTILTVLRDSAAAAHQARKKKLPINEALEFVTEESFASVQRTPELLPVLKENNVVDAGGFGLAVLIDGFTAALTGRDGSRVEEFSFERSGAPKVEIELINDWAGSQFRYCTEFLVHSDSLDADIARDFLPTMGDCDLMVGMNPNFKVHVHSNRPDQVLGWFLAHDSQISEVHIHNMQLQSEERADAISEEQNNAPKKEIGFVAVAAGEGNKKILESFGVDYVVSGGQTMNPSTKDLLDAVERTNAESVIILPNNSNIILAAQSACELAEIPCGVVPTKSVPQAFAAFLDFSEDVSLEENVEAMTEAASEVHTGEVTTAIKDSKDVYGNPIAIGDVIGIADGAIKSVGSTVQEVVLNLLKEMNADDADVCTLLAGVDLSEEEREALVGSIEGEFDDLEVDGHFGGQPLYPVVFSIE